MDGACARHRIGTWLAFAILFVGAPAAGRTGAAPGPDGAVDLLLVLAVDVSDSITPEKALLQREGFVRAVADPAVVAAIRGGRRRSIAVSYFEWASPDEQYLTVGWTRIAGAADARAFARALAKASYEYGHWTSISAAIDRAAALIAAAPFTAPRSAVDLSSDGRNNRGGPVSAARARAVGLGIAINALVVRARGHGFSLPPPPGLADYFRSCVIGGRGAFAEIADGPEDFVRAVRRKLIREIAGTAPDATVLPAAAAVCD